MAGALFALGAMLSAAVEWAWIGVLIGFALLAHVLPHLQRHQAPADGWMGRSGASLGAAGAGLLIVLGLIFLVWEAIGFPGEPAWAGVLWMAGFAAFLVGVVLFAVGSVVDDGSITEWGFYLGVPLFGLGLAWMGYALRGASPARVPMAG